MLAPARARGQVRVYAHFFDQATIDSPRSGETGALRRDEHALLAPDWLKLEPPGECLSQWHYDAIAAFGDHWKTDFSSLRNLVHQLHSLHTVTSAALADGAEIALFCRPDLRYHDSLGDMLDCGLRARRDTVFLPDWGAWHGYNDRFALAVGRRAIAAYGQRAELALRFCRATGRPLHAERMLRMRLDEAGVAVRLRPERASRVRLDGQVAEETFEPFAAMKRRHRIHNRLDRWGLLPLARRAKALLARTSRGGKNRT